MKITNEHKRDIASLVPEHCESLIAFGTNMYKSGFKRGVLMTGVGSILGCIATAMVVTCKSKK